MSVDRIPVLMYHRVDAQVVEGDRRYALPVALFAAQMAWLARHGWLPCAIDAFAAWQAGQGVLPARSVLITFDDGFAGLHTHVLPLLRARGWPATVFLVSDLIGRQDTWMATERGAVIRHALLDAAQIAEMAAAGFSFHSHSAGHADLTRLDDAALHAEVAGSRQALQQQLGQEVPYFAYPFGRHDERVRQAVVEAGYRLAFSVNPGFNRPHGDALAIRRLDITGFDTPVRFGRKLQYGSNNGALAHHWRYLAGRVASRFGLGGRP